jgi:hypothetical protein
LQARRDLRIYRLKINFELRLAPEILQQSLRLHGLPADQRQRRSDDENFRFFGGLIHL